MLCEHQLDMWGLKIHFFDSESEHCSANRSLKNMKSLLPSKIRGSSLKEINKLSSYASDDGRLWALTVS